MMKRVIVFFLLFIVTIFFVLFFEASNKFNIILISIDTVRADHLGCYGYKRNTSPNIDEFAKKATVYKNAFSQAPETIHSNYSLLTSRYPTQNKMRNWDSLLDPSVANLFSILHNNGYSIGVFGYQPMFLRNIKENFINFLNGFGSCPKSSAVLKEVLKWIQSQKSPFFLWVYYLDPHRPYNPPAPHDNLFSFKTDSHLPIETIEKDYMGGWDYIPHLIVDNGIDNPDYYIAKYDGEIHYVDEEIGKLFKWLKEKGLFTKSLIILTADHGESLGEHHLYFNHKYTLFNELIKVPLIIKWPGQEYGEVVQENAALIDILPTILAVTGIRTKNTFEGISLCNEISKNRVIVSSSKRMTALISGSWKLIKYDKRMDSKNEYIQFFFPNYPTENYQLFNIEKDPEEKVNLTQQNIDIYETMKLDLFEYEKKMNMFDFKVRSFELEEAAKKEIKSLGYLQ